MDDVNIYNNLEVFGRLKAAAIMYPYMLDPFDISRPSTLYMCRALRQIFDFFYKTA